MTVLPAQLRELRAGGGFLAGLTDVDLESLATELEEVDSPAGCELIRAGSSGDQIYLILQGRAVIGGGEDKHGPGLREEVGAGEVIGAIAFAAGGLHEADVRSVDRCRLARLTRDGFDRLLTSSPDAWRRLHELALERMRRVHLARHIDRLFGPFGTLLPYVLRELEGEVEWLVLRSGESLYCRGDPPEHAYLLFTGRLQVAAVDEAGREKITATILAGEIVGEAGLLTGRERASTVYAARDSELVRLSKHSFELMLERSSRAMFRVARVVADRLTAGHSGQRSDRAPVRCLGLVAADPEAPLSGVSRTLLERLAPLGPVALLASAEVDRALGVPGIAQSVESEPAHLRLAEWLQEREAACRYLIYQADPTWTPWSERCARQADHLAVVADGTAAPDLGVLEARLSGPRRRWSLVLVHPCELDRPRGTRRWLAASDAETVIHVRRGHGADSARLTRMLSGRAVGLVLGGGGARGFAHLGVLRALEEMGVPVDMVGATSIGAPVAGWLAQGLSAAESTEQAERAFESLIDYTLPLVSLIAGRRITAMIEGETGAWDIEDYWLPFFCMSTSLTSARSVVHQRGSSARAIRASVSIPGVLPPVPEGGELLVDGGVLNNLPIDVMRELNPFGTVIAIDVVGPRGLAPKIDHELGISGWAVLRDRLLPWKRATPLPSIAATMMQSLIVGASLARSEMLRGEIADLYLNIHVRGVSMLDFKKVRTVAEIGYKESIGALQQWLTEVGRIG